MRALPARRRTQARKVRTPLRLNACRLTQILLVERVKKLGVAAVKGSRFEH
jgi:hypothetical protein